MTKTIIGLATIVLIGASTPCLAEETTDSDEIERAIDHMISGLGDRSADMRPRLDAVTSFKDDATNALIARYDETADGLCWPIVACLCEIETSNSLSFVREIMRDHSGKYSTRAAMRTYPVAREGDVTEVLIELLNDDGLGYEARERLEASIKRDPTRAGRVVEALRDDGERARTHAIHDVLEAVSGGHGGTYSASPNDQAMIARENSLWRAWWQNNQTKDVFGWLEWAAASANESD